MKIPQKNTYSLSVHQFVDMISMGGDLSYGTSSVSQMQMGTQVHLNAQNASKHQSEVPLSYEEQYDSIKLVIKGRADIIDASGDVHVIDEIKTLFNNKEKRTVERSHMLQMQTYCAMYVLKHNLEFINGRVSYIQYDTAKMDCFDYSFTKDEILDWFFDNVNLIAERFEKVQHNKNLRNLSIKEMKFPYDNYRLGQKDMARLVFKSCQKGENLFIEAPTGIGKTLASLYPSIKAMENLDIEKIFYLSSKTTIKNIAVGAIDTLREKGLKIKSITLTAKEKSCPQKVFNCHPSICYRARGYFDRVQKALDEIDYNVHHDYEKILRLANKHSLCPFELSLNIAMEADIVICDYNNVYDPRAKIKRFFSERGDYTILVDEAHNLVGRAREMYSSALNSRMFSDLIMSLANVHTALTDKIAFSAQVILDFIDTEIDWLKKQGVTYRLIDEYGSDFIDELTGFVQNTEAIVNAPEQKPYTKIVIDSHYEVKGFLYTLSKMDESYISYAMLENGNLTYRIFCMDPSNRLSECHRISNNTIFFSASMTPHEYYARLLQEGNEYTWEKLPSPFDGDNLHVMLNATTSIEYKNRDNTMRDVVSMIHSFVTGKKGNYLIFFPSYSYMEKAHNLFNALYDDVFAPRQMRGMTGDEQDAFIKLFDEEGTHMAAFAVMGGMFSEGIDLVGNKLIGAVIVGTGFPMINLEGNMIRAYHDNNEESGMAYAYIFPGFNKVLQSVGRVVRTEKDKGAILLIDRRLAQPHYMEMMPENWQPIEYVDDEEDISRSLVEFWDSVI